MRSLVQTLSVIYFSLMVSMQIAVADDSTYTLGSGDVISINVFGEEDLTFQQLRLTDAGTLSFPFLGEVRANGLTAGELESRIADGLRGDYLIDPKVSVSVLEYREFFINGEVKSPGGYPYQPGLTLRKAVALAGGFSERASESKMFVIRDGDTSRAEQKISIDSPINPGDIVTIEQSFF